MLTNFKLLPFGIDIGATRVRVACVERNREGHTRVRAVLARPLGDRTLSVSGEIAVPELVSAVVEQLVGEIGARERRCVATIGAPAAALRVMRLPDMRSGERLQAARFEARRFANWDIQEEPSLVNVRRIEPDGALWAVGVTRERAVQSVLSTLRQARLRTVGIDHDAFALRRVLTLADAIVDIGSERTTVHAYSSQGPISLPLPCGGANVTRAIAEELSVGLESAEKRKRILGVAGAGEQARHALVTEIASAVERARARTSITRIALTGNGSRLPGLAEELEAASRAIVDVPVPEALVSQTYPDDVARAAAPDWALALGLALWTTAA